MLRQFIAFCCCLCLAMPARAETERLPDDQLPPLHVALKRDFSKWLVHDEVFGDLNGDGINDAAVILFLEPENADETGKAAVAVLLGLDAGGKEFKLQVQAGGATCVGCGGAKAPMGEPMGKLGITDKGILTIDYFGGSRTIYDLGTKWRYDKNYNRIVLIGETRITTDTMQEDPEEKLDINYSTLKAERTVGKKKTTCAVAKEYQNQELSGFDYEVHAEALEKVGERCK